MNKILHGVVLAVFASACWFMSMMLKMPGMVGRVEGYVPPAFSRLCMGVGPLLLAALVAAAVVYCCYVWTRKAEGRSTWVGFLATTMSALLMVVLPTMVAMYLPLVDFANRHAGQ